MKHSFENTDELIAKVLSGEATGEEIALLATWKNESSENSVYFNQSQSLFNAIHVSHANAPVNTAAAWNKLNQRIDDTNARIIPFYKRTAVLRAAASLLIILGLAVLIKFLITDETVPPVVFASAEKSIQQTLPDGSKVVINKNTELSYSLNKDHVREVKLKGEAFFEVVHNEKEPFVITVNDVTIKDIGTAFNVKAIPGSATIEVLVESGEVQFYSASEQGLNLHKGEKAVYDLNSKRFSKITVDPLENTGSYKSKIFHFKGTSLSEVLKQINDVYGTDIQLADKKAGNCLLSVTFNNEHVDMIVSIIAETLDLEIQRSANTIILKGTACAE